MRNKYLQNLEKLEFVVTNACTGSCKHCSEGEHTSCGERIDAKLAADAIKQISAEYDIQTVMTFGQVYHCVPKMPKMPEICTYLYCAPLWAGTFRP